MNGRTLSESTRFPLPTALQGPSSSPSISRSAKLDGRDGPHRCGFHKEGDQGLRGMDPLVNERP